jgi:hypothetical protein
MKQVEFFHWLVGHRPRERRAAPASYRMNREDAKARFPGAQPIEGTREVRDLPEREVVPEI